MESKILIVLGMHRSGTSMLAHWLTKCGLNLGAKVKQNSGGLFNNFGHVEDLDFLRYHVKLLELNNASFQVKDNKHLKIPESMKTKAKEIINKKAHLKQWGWKEPRTCLFLNLWKELIPDTYSIVIYRNYNEVVNSLYRRESNIKKKIKKITIFKRASELISYKLRKQHHYNAFLKVWIRYNKDILDHIKTSDPKNILVFSTDDLVNNDQYIYNVLTNCWGFDLEYIPMNEIFSEKHMTKSVFDIIYDDNLKKEAEEIMQEFNKIKNELLTNRSIQNCSIEN